MRLIKLFLRKKGELGYKKAIQVSLKLLLALIAGKISTLPYYLPGMIDYHFNPNALKQSDVEPFIDNEKIRKELVDDGFEVIDYDIDKADFTQWLSDVKFPEEYVEGYGQFFTEKALEHYLSSRLLDLNENDVFVDIGAASSPWYDLADRRHKCASYAVDLCLPKDRSDPRLIQCDATNTPFDDRSVSKIALHCAYEMFENDADINLIKEANRILSAGGRMVIIPLYMAHIYHIQSSPKAKRKGIEYGKAKRVWLEDKLARSVRMYSVEALKERVANNKRELDLKIFYFTNEKEMKQNPQDQIYVKFAARFTKG